MKVDFPGAIASISHHRDGLLLHEETVHNLVTSVGRDFLHQQGYATSTGTNGLNYIGLSNDAFTETSASTTLSNEITANGLARAQGTVAHTADTNITTITHVFTCTTAAQASQKAALFTAASGGIMCHPVSFTQRSLEIGDSLTVQIVIPLG